ncbi:MAG: hypothetical protein R3D98_05035 [Candidatus Krumholzibacteriia bacterium]
MDREIDRAPVYPPQSNSTSKWFDTLDQRFKATGLNDLRADLFVTLSEFTPCANHASQPLKNLELLSVLLPQFGRNPTKVAHGLELEWRIDHDPKKIDSSIALFEVRLGRDTKIMPV